MAWVASSPNLQVPLPLSSRIVSLAPLPQTPLLALVTSTTLVIYEANTLLPVAVHKRTPECLESHGFSIDAQIRHVAVDSAALEKMNVVDVHVRTKLNFVLIFSVAISYGKSLYEISESSNHENVLQNSLPLAAANTKNSLSSMFKSATRSLIHGSTASSNMACIEHFNHSAADDEERNEYIPLVKVVLNKALKLSSQISRFWCKPNSRNVIFFNSTGGDSQIQVLNTRTFKSDALKLSGCSWYFDTTLLEYNIAENFFLHVNSERELSLLEFGTDEGDSNTELTLKHTFLAKMDAGVEQLAFSPQSSLLLVRTTAAVELYAFALSARKLRRINTIATVSEKDSLNISWSPCGEFFVGVDSETHFWKLYSKFGSVCFDSAQICTEIDTAFSQNPAASEKPGDFCKVSKFVVSSNASTIYLVNSEAKTLYKLPLTRLVETHRNDPLFLDGNYISSLDTFGAGGFARVPIPPFFQKVFADLQHINGYPLKKISKMATGIFTGRINKYRQLSLAHGGELTISTPISSGSEYKQVYWFRFYNHFVGSVNIVDHMWIEDFLLVVNRTSRDDIMADTGNASDAVIDEVILLNTKQAKYGAGGVQFKFDSDLISWRHTFKNRILRMEVSPNPATQGHTLTLVTHDMKIILIDIDVHTPPPANAASSKTAEPPKIAIKVRRTIHLSSIKHKLPISTVRDVLFVTNKHFLFLLDTGECYLLKNQQSAVSNGSASRTQTNNMYDLIEINAGVERMSAHSVSFRGTENEPLVSLFKGENVLVYNVHELVARPHEFVGTENGDAAKLRPVQIHTAHFTPMQLFQTSGTLGIAGFESQVSWKNENLTLKNRPGRLSILDKFIHRELFGNATATNAISAKFSVFQNYTYCLELLLFEQLEFLGQTPAFEKVCGLVDASAAANTIYVNFLRKIEVHYWKPFFKILGLTPIEFMNKLICSKNVDLCYSYISIYLNFKREHDMADGPEKADFEKAGPENHGSLGGSEQQIIMQIVRMLMAEHKWDECFELCRFVKLLQPSGTLLREVRACVAN